MNTNPPNDESEMMVCARPEPTPVTSGQSPVTAGDLSYVVQQMLGLPYEMIVALSAGSLTGDACRVCQVLQEGSWPPKLAIAQRLHDWHGADAIRCGVIYGTARALLEQRRVAPASSPVTEADR